MRTQRVKELVIRAGNFPWNKSAHSTGCVAQVPGQSGRGGRQVAAMQPLGNAVQGISKATEHMSQLSLVVQGLPHALGSSWSPYPSPNLPSSSFLEKPRPLGLCGSLNSGGSPKRRHMRCHLCSPQGSHGLAEWLQQT